MKWKLLLDRIHAPTVGPLPALRKVRFWQGGAPNKYAPLAASLASFSIFSFKVRSPSIKLWQRVSLSDLIHLQSVTPLLCHANVCRLPVSPSICWRCFPLQELRLSKLLSFEALLSTKDDRISHRICSDALYPTHRYPNLESAASQSEQVIHVYQQLLLLVLAG